MTKQNFPFYFLLQERAKPLLPPYLLPLPPRTNLNPPLRPPLPPRTNLNPYSPSKDFVACGSARTRAFLIKPLVLPSAHPSAHTSIAELKKAF